MNREEIQANIDSTQAKIDDYGLQLATAQTAKSKAEAAIVNINTNRWGGGVCKGNKHGNSYKGCVADNQAKDREVANQKAIISTQTGLIASLKNKIETEKSLLSTYQEELDTLSKSNSHANQELAKQGSSLEAVNTAALAQGQALLTKTTIAAQTEAETTKKKVNVKLIIILAVAGIVLTVGTILLIKKLKKK